MLEPAVIQPQFAAYRGWTLLAGFSGGADSLALLLLLHDLQKSGNFTLKAVHCEHGLRGAASLADADFCRNICRKYGIALEVHTLNVPENRLPGENVEAAARRLRLAVWRELAANRPQTAVVLAHHAGDRRENLLLRLLRGSGGSGLAGLRAERDLAGIRFLRPLLHAERSELEDFLHRRGEDRWCEDATNCDTHYRRNFLRHEILPRLQSAIPEAGSGMNAALDALEEDAVFLELLAHQATEKLPENGADSAAWQQIPAALHGRILRELSEQEWGPGWLPDRNFLNRFRAMLTSGETNSMEIMPGRFWGNRSGTWRFSAAHEPEKVQFFWHWRQEKRGGFSAEPAAGLPEKTGLDEAYFDAAKLPETLLAASGEDRERMIPFGHKHPVLWKELRIKRGIARAEAPPLLRLPDGAILWSPLIRHSESAKINAETREIVHFRWQKE